MLHEPTQSVCPFSPDLPPGSSTFQASSPVFLSIARRKVRSPGPKFWMTRSPWSSGEAALPQMWRHAPRSRCHNSLPSKS